MSRIARNLVLIALVLGVRQGLSGVVAYWPFSPDNELADLSGNSHALNQAGIAFSGGAAVFDKGASTFMRTDQPLDLTALTNLTLECFFKIDSTNGLGAYAMLMRHGAVSSAAGASYVAYRKDSFDIQSHSQKANATFDQNDTAVLPLGDGTWHHVALVVDNGLSGADRARLFVDYLPATQSNGGDDTVIPFIQEIFYIGSHPTTADYQFKGAIDDVRISDEALPPDRFLRSPSVAVPLVAHWPFDAGDTLADASGNNRALTNLNGVTFARDAAVFAGGSARLRTRETLNLSGYTNLTVECYFFSTNPPPSDASAFAVEHSENSGQNVGTFYLVGAQKDTARVTSSLRTAGGYNSDISAAHIVTTNGVWHHLALVVNSATSGADRACLYVDHLKQGSDGLNDATATALADKFLYIGTRGDTVTRLHGLIDDVRLTGDALSPDRFMASRSGTVPDPLPVVAYWPFLPGNELQDLSGNGNVLTNDGVSFSAGAALFNGNHAVFRTLSSMRLARHYNLTVECFIRVPTNIPSGSGIAAELSSDPSFRQGAFSLVGVKGSVSGYPGAVESAFRNLSLYNSDRSANRAVTDGTWHHLAMVIDNRSFRSLRVRLYLDSVLQSAAEYNDDTYCAFADEIVYIGSRGNSSLRLTGQLDDVRITAAALTPDLFLKARTRPNGTMLRVF